jgi:hypothetical protein
VRPGGNQLFRSKARCRKESNYPNDSRGKSALDWSVGRITVDNAVDASVCSDSEANRKKDYMLWTIAAVLLVLWAVGLIAGFTVSGLIHVLLVIAVIAILVRLITGRRLA